MEEFVLAKTAQRLVVCADNKRFYQDAEMLAKHLEVDYINSLSDVDKTDLVLYFTKDGLALQCGNLSMIGDFTEMIPRVKEEMWQHEMLVKAARFKNKEGKLTAIDATAGMGEDSLLLAAAGFYVTLYEYDPVIAALLKDTLRRAKKIPELREIVSRMKVVEGDSIEAMSKCLDKVDLIYLDPMFPERQKTGMIKKKFQLLQKLERPCMNEDSLLEAAKKAKPEKIVIKRPAKGPYIAGVKPDFSFQGKAIRYDCFSFQ